MDRLYKLKVLAHSDEWGQLIMDLLESETSNFSDQENEDDDATSVVEKNMNTEENLIVNRNSCVETDEEEDVCWRFRSLRVGNSEPCSRQSRIRPDSPCVAYGRNVSCPCSFNKNLEHQEYESQYEFRNILEQHRQYPNTQKPSDHNFIEEFKVVQKSKKCCMRHFSARPLFHLPSVPTQMTGTEYYKNWNGIWVKRRICPDGSDPFPVKHKVLYPSRSLQEHTATEYTPTH